MRVTIVTAGSQGDVRPYAVFAAALVRAGHPTRIACDPSFARLVEGTGAELHPMRADFMSLAEPGGARDGVAGKPSLSLLRRAFALLRVMLDDAAPAADGADLVVYHPKALAGRHLAEARGIPAVLALPAPALSPTAAFPCPLLTTRSLGPRWNRFTYWPLRLIDLPYRHIVRAWRRERLGLGPASPGETIRGVPVPRLYPCSPSLVPRPADWDDSSLIAGAWEGDVDDGPLPADLEAFLGAGDPPIFIGFGSMPVSARLRGIVIEAVRHIHHRVLIQMDQLAVPEDLAARVRALGPVPHRRLFPRVAAVVHHGGAGTTHAGLAAGRPTLVLPFFGDQPFWGARVAAAGAGGAPLPARRIRPAPLSAALDALVRNPHHAEAAARLAASMRTEDGLAASIGLLERVVP